MGIAYRSTLGEPPTGNAVVGDVLYGKTFSNADGTDKVGTMPNNGAVAPTALDPGGSYTIPAGYHNGQGAVSAKSNTGTYTASSRGAALDMGAANLNRYVNTNGVPNSNTGTYTFPANDTGGTKDLGEANNYRYVNAQNVYNKGKADASGAKQVLAVAMGNGYNFSQYYNNGTVTGTSHFNTANIITNDIISAASSIATVKKACTVYAINGGATITSTHYNAGQTFSIAALANYLIIAD